LLQDIGFQRKLFLVRNTRQLKILIIIIIIINIYNK
jgi:hypothetical protein